MTDKTPTDASAPADATASQPDEFNIQSTGTEQEEAAAPTAEETAAAAAAEAKAAEDAAKAEAEAAKVDRPAEPFQKAFNKIAFEKREAERAAKEARDELAAYMKANPKASSDAAAAAVEGDTVPRAELQRLAQEEAKRIHAQESAEAQARNSAKAFNDAADEVYANGTKDFPDFENAVSNLRMLGHMNYQTVEAALATENPQRVLYELGKNHAEAERIMALPPLKMAVAFAKLADKAPPAPEKRPVSAAPAPVAPIEGGVRISDELRDEDSDSDWGKKFEKKMAGRVTGL